MKLVQLYIPVDLLDGLQRLVDAKLYPNRAEAIRLAVRDLINRRLGISVLREEVLKNE